MYTFYTFWDTQAIHRCLVMVSFLFFFFGGMTVITEFWRDYKPSLSLSKLFNELTFSWVLTLILLQAFLALNWLWTYGVDQLPPI